MNREQQEEVQKTVSKLKINKTEEFAAIHGIEHTKASSITGSTNSINTQIIEEFKKKTKLPNGQDIQFKSNKSLPFANGQIYESKIIEATFNSDSYIAAILSLNNSNEEIFIAGEGNLKTGYWIKLFDTKEDCANYFASNARGNKILGAFKDELYKVTRKNATPIAKIISGAVLGTAIGGIFFSKYLFFASAILFICAFMISKKSSLNKEINAIPETEDLKIIEDTASIFGTKFIHESFTLMASYGEQLGLR